MPGDTVITWIWYAMLAPLVLVMFLIVLCIAYWGRIKDIFTDESDERNDKC